MANSKDYAIQVKDVKKSFYLPHHKNDSLKSAITQVFKSKEKGGKTFNALNGVSFNVEKGDFFGVLGRNGSGKSTLLKIISEIYQPTSGSVKHDGKLVSFIELGVGFKAELSGRENVFLNGALLGFSKEEVASMYDDIVAFAELEEFMDQKLKNYSSGMRVRLAFSVAIRAKADILILDEVLAVGDASFQKKCTDYFETLKEDGKTVILVTHSMGNVRQFCNKAVVIDGGKVIYEGDADTAADKYSGLFEVRKKDNLDRLGTGSVRIVEKPEVEVTKDTIEIGLNLHSTENLDVYVAADIYKGSVLVGGFSMKDTGDAVRLKKSKATDIHVSVDNVFGGGEYTITLSIRSAHDNEVCDFWKNAQTFSNVFVSNSYLPVNLRPSVVKK